MDTLAMRAGDVCWLHGFGGVKVNGVSLWPARLVVASTRHQTSALPPAVQKACRPNTVLVQSFGDYAYVWAKPNAVRVFNAEDIDEALVEKAGSRVQTALGEALAALKPQKPLTPAKHKRLVRLETHAPVPSPPATTATLTKKQAKARAPAPRPSPPAERDSSGLSAYELQRLETMRQNQLVLESLGVASASESLRLATATPEKPAVDPAVRAAKAAERHARMLEAQANRRQSSRLLDLPETERGRIPKRYAEEYAAIEDAEREHVHLRKKMRRVAASGRKNAERAWLDPEERAAIAEACFLSGAQTPVFPRVSSI